MKNYSIVLKIAFAAAIGIFVGSYVTPMFGLMSTWASFAVSTGITITLLIIIEGITNKLTTGKTTTLPLGDVKSLRKVKKDEISKAAVVLADAFKDDPLFKKIFEKDVHESQNNTHIEKMFLKYCIKYGEVYASSENLEGIMAITQDKNSYMPMWRLIRSGAIFPFLRIGLKSFIKMARTLGPIDEVRKKQMKHKSFIYILIIGVSAENQGKGYGGKLLRALIDLSDNINIPIYLETETESNVSLYERFGFKTIEHMKLPVINQPMWAMIREVQGGV